MNILGIKTVNADYTAYISWESDAVWLVVEAAEVVIFDGKAKAHRLIIIHIGDRLSATAYLQERAIGRCIVERP